MSDHKNELVALVEKADLEKQKADALIDQFSDIAGVAASWDARAREIKVTNESQAGEMMRARELRLEIRQKRLEVERTRKSLKEQALREGQAIDSVARWIKGLIEPTEQYLDEQEHFAENKRKKEEAARQAEAERLLREKEERERIEREAEQKRIREENERLKREAEEREQQVKAEREAVERKAAEERRAAEEKARAEREAHERELAEQRRIGEEKAAKERAEAQAKAELERAEYERKLAQVKCPQCGNVFDSRDHAAVGEVDHGA